jgi:regulatory protein
MDPIEVAVRSLRTHDRSRAEIDERLAKAGISEQDRPEALDRLESLGYVDDGRLAMSRAAALADRGQGDTAIRFDLRGRGIADDAIETALAEVVPEVERAVKLAEQLGRTPKTAARLRRKGFGADALEAAFGEGIAAAGT